jgi:hypothetical protein
MGFFDSVSSFFSDQKNRISNVIGSEVSVIKNAIGMGTYGDQFTGTNKLGELGSAIGNNPKTSAAVGAIGYTAGPAIGAKFLGSSLGTQAAVSTAGLVAAGAAYQNPGGFSSAVLTTPSNLFSVGGQGMSVIENPTSDNITAFAKEHPVATTSAVAALLIGGGKAAQTAYSGYLSYAGIKATNENTAAVDKNNSLMGGSSSGSPPPAPTPTDQPKVPTSQPKEIAPSYPAIAATSTPPPSVIPVAAIATPKKKTVKKKKKKTVKKKTVKKKKKTTNYKKKKKRR